MQVFDKVTVIVTLIAGVHLFSYSAAASNDKSNFVKQDIKKEFSTASDVEKPLINKVSKLFHLPRKGDAFRIFHDENLNSLTPAAYGGAALKKNSLDNQSGQFNQFTPLPMHGIDEKSLRTKSGADVDARLNADALVLTAAAGKVLKKAIKNPDKLNWQEAYSIVASGGTKESLKLLQWLDFKRKKTTAPFEQITQFIAENPDWPGINILRRNAEKSVASAQFDKDVTDWFGTFSPISIDGKTAYIEKLLSQGYTDKAKLEIDRVWSWSRFSKKEQQAFLKKFGKYLNKENHAQRADNILWQRRATEARRVLPLLDKNNKLLSKARIALIFRTPGVDAAIRRVPKTLKNHPGLIYERAVWRKRAKQYERTADFILANDEATKTYPTKWWKLRKYVAMKLVAKKQYDKAYKLVSEHNMPHEGVSFADAEWLAGWMSLRFKKNDKQAFNHFRTLYDNVNSAVSKSRGAYWSGMACVKNSPGLAEDYFKKAAFFSTTFYGQLAASRIQDKTYWYLPKEPAPSRAMINQLKNDELIRIVSILDVLEQDKMMKVFVKRLYDMAETPEKVSAIAEVLGGHVSRPDLSVVVARRARMDGIELTESGYPVVSKDFTKEILEKALTLAIVRQESSFQVNAVSPARAYGIMQIIPSTAKLMSKKLGMHYSTAKLKNDPVYNMTLGSNYLKRMIAEFDGSYVLAIAAYNAGPHLVKRWVKKFGDPIRGEIDMIDWIESIPFTETQNYVQRVVENLYVYRRLFGDHDIINTLQGNLRVADDADVVAVNEGVRRNRM